MLHKSAVSGMYLRDDPTILGWELANSPLCPGDDSGNAVQVPFSKLIRRQICMPVTVVKSSVSDASSWNGIFVHASKALISRRS